MRQMAESFSLRFLIARMQTAWGLWAGVILAALPIGALGLGLLAAIFGPPHQRNLAADIDIGPFEAAGLLYLVMGIVVLVPASILLAVNLKRSIIARWFFAVSLIPAILILGLVVLVNIRH